ncbi:MAG: hypothetical protein WAK31_07600, partial [Chthoniobacterales bacterium]
DPQTLNPEQRSFVADQMYEGVRFPKDPAFYIVPPTIEGFLAAVNYGMEVKKHEGLGGSGLLMAQGGLGLGQVVVSETLRFAAVEEVRRQYYLQSAVTTAQKETIAKRIGEIKLSRSQNDK